MAFPGRVYGKFGWEKVITSAKKGKLGTAMELLDGRVFRYARNGAAGALDSGELVMQKDIVASQGVDFAVKAAAKGKTAITLTVKGAQFAKDAYADGLIFVNDQGADTVSGEGMLYVIKSHPLIKTSSTGVITLDEEDGIADQAWTTNTQIGLRKNKFSELETWDANDIDGIPMGVAPVRVSKTYYFWCQTWGSAAVKTNGTIVLGEIVKPKASGTVDGAVAAFASITATSAHTQQKQHSVGIVESVGASTEYSLVFLTIAP